MKNNKKEHPILRLSDKTIEVYCQLLHQSAENKKTTLKFRKETIKLKKSQFVLNAELISKECKTSSRAVAHQVGILEKAGLITVELTPDYSKIITICKDLAGIVKEALGHSNTCLIAPPTAINT